MRKWVAVATVTVAVITAGCAIGYWWMGTPEYSLSKIRHAYETHDYQEFIKYYDVDAISRRAGEEFINSQEKTPTREGENSTGCCGTPPTQDEKVYWRTRVQKETAEWHKSAFAEGLRSGTEWFGDFTTGRVQVTEGGVLVEIANKKSRAKLRMIRIKGRRWRVVEITEWEWRPVFTKWH